MEKRCNLLRPLSLPTLNQMAMLLKLQESANYIESPEREGCLDPTLQATLWLGLSVELRSCCDWHSKCGPEKTLKTQ